MRTDTAANTIDPTVLFFATTCHLAATPEGQAHQDERLRNLLRQGINAHRLLPLVERHRTYALTPTVLRRHDLLRIVPTADRDALLQQEQRTRLNGLRLAAECARLRDLMTKEGITVRVLKGPPLSARLYGDVGLRHSKDLDLWVPESDVVTAVRLLRTLGYRMISSNDAVYRYSTKLALNLLFELSFVHRTSHHVLDLHWRVELPAGSSYEPVWQELFCGAHQDAGEFLYLIWHGSRHLWARLKWLGDIQSWLERDPRVLPECAGFAHRLNLEPSLIQAQVLCHRLFGASAPELPHGRSADTATGLKLTHAAQRRIVDMRELDQSSLRDMLVTERRYERILQRRHHMRERLLLTAQRILISQWDVEHIPLPRWAAPLFPLIRPFSLLIRLTIRAVREAGFRRATP